MAASVTRRRAFAARTFSAICSRLVIWTMTQMFARKSSNTSHFGPPGVSAIAGVRGTYFQHAGKPGTISGMTTAMTERPLTFSEIASSRIRGLRAERNWNQAELALRVGLSRPALSDRESGRKPVNLDELPAFAEALNCSVAYLMGLENDRSRPLEGAAADALRACRDSNPKPSDP
ncbi:helix-turn-helix domain-containing protein [Nocardioides maradonensis]